ncbi:MAG: DUF3761 domain-containing protein [Bacteroidota bacterium]|nr:DUF3761 domain-containing protein [Bacteroidota bacterium]
MKLRSIILSLFVFLFSFVVRSQDFITINNLNLRESSNSASKIISVIPKGDRVSLIDKNGDWYFVTYNGLEGYVNKALVKELRTLEKSKKYRSSFDNQSQKVKYYKNVNGEEIQSPTYYDKQPEGATAICRDGTYSFSRNRRGTCSHHGGVKKWL